MCGLGLWYLQALSSVTNFAIGGTRPERDTYLGRISIHLMFGVDKESLINLSSGYYLMTKQQSSCCHCRIQGNRNEKNLLRSGFIKERFWSTMLLRDVNSRISPQWQINRRRRIRRASLMLTVIFSQILRRYL